MEERGWRSLGPIADRPRRWMHPNVRLDLEPNVCTAAHSGAVKLGIKLCDKARQVFCNRQSPWGTHHAGVRSLEVTTFRCRSSGAPRYFHLAQMGKRLCLRYAY